MGTINVNIQASEVLKQKESITSVKTVNKFDAKNYLNTRLEPMEKQKKIVIRLLPFSADGGTPFKKVYMHTVKVNKELSPSGWKSFVCPKHNDFNHPESHSDKCPFCETAAEARNMMKSELTEVEKEKYGNIAFSNSAREMWIVRCIERGKEEDGPKFWLFAHSRKGDGIYDKIMNIFMERMEEGKKLFGKDINVFDLNEGKDLILTITKDTNGHNVFKIVDSSYQTPLSENTELAMSWIQDEKKWDEVYTVKPYEFMSIVVQGGVPFYDTVEKRYVDKKEFESNKVEREKTEYENAYTPIPTLTAPTAENIKETVTNSANQSFDDGDDLPF